LHCSEIEGRNIAVQLYQHRRASGVISEFSPSAPPFVPSGSAYPTPYPTQVSFLEMTRDFSLIPYQYSPPRASPFHARSPLPFIHGPGQQVQLAPLHGPGSTSHSGLIDPCNLFCKVRVAQHSSRLLLRFPIRISILTLIQTDFSRTFAR
jgi:polyadenylate-binding protein